MPLSLSCASKKTSSDGRTRFERAESAFGDARFDSRSGRTNSALFLPEEWQMTNESVACLDRDLLFFVALATPSR